MRLLATALAATQRPTGLGVYARMIIDALQPEDDVIVAAWSPVAVAGHRVDAGPLPGDRGARALLRRLRWSATQLNTCVRRLGIEGVLHLLPELGLTTVPQVVVVHDLAPLIVPTTRLQRLYMLSVVRESARRAAGIIADCEQTASDVQRIFSVPSSRIRVALCGVDLDVFAPSKRQASVRPFIMAVGNPAPNKRMDLLMRAFAASRTRQSHSLKLVGPTDHRYTPGLRRLAEELGVTEQVSFTPYVCRDALARLYASASVYVSASSYEGFGLPGLEALSSGTPIVATRVGAVGDYAGGCAAAVLMESTINATEMATAIDMAVDRLAPDELIRNAARVRAEKYPWRGTTSTLLEATRDLMSG